MKVFFFLFPFIIITIVRKTESFPKPQHIMRGMKNPRKRTKRVIKISQSDCIAHRKELKGLKRSSLKPKPPLTGAVEIPKPFLRRSLQIGRRQGQPTPRSYKPNRHGAVNAERPWWSNQDVRTQCAELRLRLKRPSRSVQQGGRQGEGGRQWRAGRPKTSTGWVLGYWRVGAILHDETQHWAQAQS